MAVKKRRLPIAVSRALNQAGLTRESSRSTRSPERQAADAAWEGVYEWVMTDPLGLTTRLVSGAIAVERGSVR